MGKEGKGRGGGRGGKGKEKYLPDQCQTASGAPVMRCPCVCPSVTFVNSIKMNKHLQNFLPSGSHTIIVLFVPNGIEIFRRKLP